MMKPCDLIRFSLWRAKPRVGTYRALWLTPMLLASTVFANNAKISPDLQSLLSNPSSKVNVIVQYNSLPCFRRWVSPPRAQPAPHATLLGGTVTQVLSLFNAVAGTMAAGRSSRALESIQCQLYFA